MKTKPTIKLLTILPLLSTLFYQLSTTTAPAQGTAFTYQGRLNSGTDPATGSYDLKFALFSTSSGVGQVGNLMTNSATAVSNGLFTVTLDFGNQFPGANRWLEIAVRTNGSASAYTVLSPREALTAIPYAITAGNLTGTLAGAQLTGALPSAQLTGTYAGAVNLSNAGNTFTGSGSGLTGVNAATLNGYGYCALPCYWNLAGNAGISPGVDFVGTTDNQPLTLKVNNTIALRITPGTTLPNIVGGLAGFRPSVIASNVSGAVIAGGNAPSGGVNGFGGGDFQAVYDNDGAVGGGFGNKVGNGNVDVTDAAFATVAGGVFNSATAYGAAVGGGDSNVAGGQRAAVGGGYANQALGAMSFIGGGLQNNTQTNATYSVVGGGQQNSVAEIHAFIGAGSNNTIQTGSWAAAIVGGSQNTIQTNSFDSTIAGGVQNVIQFGSVSDSGAYCFIGAGMQNTIQHDSEASVIAGGLNNTIEFNGQLNTIGGGWLNAIRRGPGFPDNSFGSVIAGGAENLIVGTFYGAIGGGNTNSIGNGSINSVIAGGSRNSIGPSAQNATIGGGLLNSIQANAQDATIGGGTLNSCLANISTVPGGYNNIAGFSSFAAGTQARATNESSFVWADNQGTAFSSTANNQVSFRCLGGVRFASGSGAANQTVAWTPGAASWSFSSDRALKEGFEAVNGAAVLEKVVRLPISEWNYKGYSQRHIGAMAQDFQAAFPLNESTTTLNDADLHGVALAAIQGLNEKVDELKGELKCWDTENAELKQQNKSLEKRLDKIEQLIENQTTTH